MKGGAKRRKTSARGERRKGERRERGNKMNRRERRRREKETAAGGSVGASLFNLYSSQQTTFKQTNTIKTSSFSLERENRLGFEMKNKRSEPQGTLRCRLSRHCLHSTLTL
jgi:hypothetical protein